MEKNSIEQIWLAAKNSPEMESPEWKLDKFGKLMKRSEFNNKSSEFGWIIEQSRTIGKISLEFEAVNLNK